MQGNESILKIIYIKYLITRLTQNDITTNMSTLTNNEKQVNNNTSSNQPPSNKRRNPRN